MISHDVMETLMCLLAEHSSPTVLYSDNRPQFDSHDFTHFAASFELWHITSSLLHPWSHFIVEWQVHTLKDLIKRSSNTAAFFKGLCVPRSMSLDANLPLPV